MKFGEKLRWLRRKKGLSLMELGELLEVHHSHVGRLEKGEKTPNVAMVLKLAEIFGVTTDWLIRDEMELDDN